ncbi:MAG TPA: hypothetical protein EYG72_03395 [Candidatus Pacebacteria bacterium]|nr:hypothetical protein [Candidatus Paceibacterota bacterium]
MTAAKDAVKKKAVEKMLEKQLENVPEEQKAAVVAMVEENPDFFKDIAEEIEREVKGGKSQMVAGMSVMRKHQTKMQAMMMKSMGGNQNAKNRNLR